MALNHHVLAKTTTDAILQKFKSAAWQYNGGWGSDFYRVGTSADFPSPDAAFYDPTNEKLASFEFKPATETKRGMLTGVGQSIAYLKKCDLAYLISPQVIDGFNMGDFLTELYQTQIGDSVPIGLVLYDNNDPSKIILAHNVNSLSATTTSISRKTSVDRFWAKHQDMPIPMFHLLLHYYYLKRVGIVNGDAFAACWQSAMLPSDLLTNFTARPVADINGNAIKTLAGRKHLTFLEKNLQKIKSNEEAINWEAKVREQMGVFTSGDHPYTGVRKNYVTFLKHLQVIDSEGNLTDSGFNLYHLGLVNGPTSKIFTDYFTREVLTTGHHLDVLLDFDTLRQNNPTLDVKTIISRMETDYENKGYIERNPGRIAGTSSKTLFLKYEGILWRALGLIDKQYNIQWRKITEICALPEL